MDDLYKIGNAVEVLFNIAVWVIIVWAVAKWNKKKKTTADSPVAPVKDLMGTISNLAKSQSIDQPPPPPGKTATAYVGTELTALVGAVKSLGNQRLHVRLEKRKKYLQVALNSTLNEARSIISQLPRSDRILIEAGTPLIKIYGEEAVRVVRTTAPFGSYIVADIKTADLARREVEIMARAGANGITCLGVAPVETIDEFIAACNEFGCDSMIDMMNVERSLYVLKKLKKLPEVVVLHRGVDESEFSKEKQIPFYEIQQLKGSYNLMVAVAGGDTSREIQRAILNGADIVVAWKDFYQSSAATGRLALDFLKEIK